jgi:serine/threonine protein kinase
VWDDYEADTELIGRGAFARVFKALRRSDGSPVAIKVIGRDTKAFKQQSRGEGVRPRRTPASGSARRVCSA